MNDITSRFLEAYRWILSNNKTPDTKTFAKELGISISMMTEIAKERSNIGIKAIQNIVKKFHINSEWLLTGKGEMLREEPTLSKKPYPVNDSEQLAAGGSMLREEQPVVYQANDVYKELYEKEREKNEELSVKTGKMGGEIEILQKENGVLEKKNEALQKANEVLKNEILDLKEELFQHQTESFIHDSVVAASKQEVPPPHASIAGVPLRKNR
ncbi:hypothetical protein EZS27_009190 [termite gut metagenome]|uniref:HTH cro/C1-type domain-containing protein n=1 Tax=termite gut metagenome TaxID=433724 RepID=A0A5J4SAH3_9ZZZZ